MIVCSLYVISALPRFFRNETVFLYIRIMRVYLGVTSSRDSVLSRLWDAAPETQRTAVRSYSAAPCARVESSCFGTACTRREATKCDS